MANKILKIEGMTCAACAKAVERAAKKLDGVTEANVNVATEKLNVTFDEGKSDLEKIKAAIEKAVVKAGYKASETETTVDKDKERKEKKKK